MMKRSYGERITSIDGGYVISARCKTWRTSWKGGHDGTSTFNQGNAGLTGTKQTFPCESIPSAALTATLASLAIDNTI